MTARSWRPSRIEAIATGAAALVGLLVLVAPSVRATVSETGFFLLEIVSILLDRPTSLVVSGYAVCTLLALGADALRPTTGRILYVSWIPAFLALLGGAYLLALGAVLAPLLVVVPGVAVVVGWFFGRRFAGSERSPVPPIVTLFCLLHLAVEGTAGHILTPYLHLVNASAASLSFAVPLLYDVLFGIALVGVGLLFVPGAHLVPALIAAAVLSVAGALLPGSVPWVALVGAGLLVGGGAAARGDRLLDWLHLDPLKCLHAVGPVAAIGLLAVTAHYGSVMWRCDTVGAEGAELIRLSDLDGTFDLEPTLDGQFLVVSRREPQEIVVLELVSHDIARRTSTARPTDSAFNHTEPETVVATGGTEVLMLLASSDSEEGNRLVRYDAATGAWTGELEGLGEGVSDLRRDRRGGVWVSTEFRGRLAQVDPRTMGILSDREVRGAETNAIAVDVDGGRAWSVGLWADGWLRKIDLRSGQQLGSVWLGTRQWDLAWDPNSDRIYIPRLTDGVVEVIHGDTLQQVAGWDVGFGARPIEISDDGRFLAVGNLYSGEVLGWDLTTAERTMRAFVGGHVKGLRMGPDGTVYTGSNCGVFALRRGE